MIRKSGHSFSVKIMRETYRMIRKLGTGFPLWSCGNRKTPAAMQFALNEDQLAVRDMARDFAAENIAPHALALG